MAKATQEQEFSWDIKSNFVDNVDFETKDAETFLALLNEKAESGAAEQLPVPGSILTGKIVEISKDFAIIDVGLKSEGLIDLNEFSSPEELELGQEVEVYLEEVEGNNGQIVLSREKAERQRQWEYILEHCEEGSIVKGRITRKVKGGLMVDVGMEAFLPGSQIDNKRIKNLDDYLGHTYDFKILKINIERKNVVVSRRELLEIERLAKKQEILENIETGDIRKGVVKNITDFGVFLDLDGLDGLLHITDMTWKRIRHPSEMVHLGQELDVMIIGIDKEKGRVALGLKQKEANPWEQIEEKYPPGTKIQGKIVNLLPYGAFIEIEPGIEGLIHVSEMSWVKNVTDPSKIVNKGDEIEAVVLAVQKDEGKISLGMKQLEDNPWMNIEEKYPVGKNVEVEIRSLTNYGAFVELEPGIDGLIHISDLSWIKKVSHPSELLKKGDMVDAIILSVDKDSKKITLGVKQLSDNPWESIEKTMPIGSNVKGTVTKITGFGAFVKLDNGIEGLIHVTELSDRPFGKVEDVVAQGDEVIAKVIKIDPEHKKIALSIKEHLIDETQVNRDDIVIGEESATAEEALVETNSDETSTEE
ncbi:MAG: 30S ribosomal protein S1 [Chlamydiota bacterium]